MSRFAALRNSLLCCVVAAAVICGEAPAARPIAPKMLPEKTLVYFRVASTPDLVKRFQQTGTGRMARDEKLQPLLGQFWQMAVDAYGRVEKEINISLAELLAIPQGELTLALVAAAEGPPQVVAWVDCTDHVRTVQKLLDRGEQELLNRGVERKVEKVNDLELIVHEFGNGDRRLVYVLKDETLIVSSNVELAKQLITLWNGQGPDDLVTLADNRKFTSIMSRSQTAQGEEPQVTWFFDPIEAATTVGRGNASSQAGMAILRGLGLDGIKALGGSVTFATEEFDALFHSHLLLENPRRGVVDALALRTGDVDPESWVPADIESYTTLNWDLGRTYDTAVRLFEMFRGQGAWDGQVLLPAFDRVGIHLDKEIVHALTGRMTLVTWMEKPARLNSQSTLFGLQLKDTKASQAVLEKLVARFSDKFTKKTYGGLTYYASPLNQNPNINLNPDVWRQDIACVMLLDDYLLVTNSEKLLQHAVFTRNDPTGKLASELDYKIIASRIKRQLGESSAGMISFSRPEEGMRQLYELATSEKMRAELKARGEANPFFKGVDSALGANPLPPFSVIAQYLSPSGALVTSDETGIHYLAFNLRREE